MSVSKKRTLNHKETTSDVHIPKTGKHHPKILKKNKTNHTQTHTHIPKTQNTYVEKHKLKKKRKNNTKNE